LPLSDLFQPVKRATILIPDGSNAGRHLHVVLTDTCDDGKNLIISISSIGKKPFYDATCLLGENDCDWLKEASFAFYAQMKIVDSELLIKNVRENRTKYEGLLEEVAFAHVCHGIEQSKFAAPEHKEYYVSNS